MLKKLFIVIFILSLFSLNPLKLLSKEVKIVQKINNEIITNIDIEIEALYLMALNPKFANIEKDKLLKLAKQSIIKEKIKKNELKKFFDLEKKQQIVTNYIETLYKNLGHKNKKEFTDYLNKSDLKYENIYKKINIELAWNEFIYAKYKDQIKINKKKIEEKLKSIKIEYKIYNLSEILFTGLIKSDLEQKFKELIENIDKLGFDKTAFLYSESDTQKDSGLIGWVNENQLSQQFKNELNILNEGQITNPINVPSGKIILKINKIKTDTQKIDIEKELKQAIIFEKDRQLNNFSIIYYNKIKNKEINNNE